MNINEKKFLKQGKNCDKIDEYFILKMYDKMNYSDENFAKLSNDGNVVKGKNFVKNVEKHIKTIQENFGYDRDEIILEAEKSEMFRHTVLATKVSRQNFYEKEQSNILSNIIESLNKEHKNELHCVMNNNKDTKFVIDDDGCVRKRSRDRKRGNEESKSFDFIIDIIKQTKTGKILLFNKYTKEGGGAQDDVQIETMLTLNRCGKCKRDNVKFVFYLDGEYWEENKKNLNEYPNCFIVNSENIEKVIKDIINKF